MVCVKGLINILALQEWLRMDKAELCLSRAKHLRASEPPFFPHTNCLVSKLKEHLAEMAITVRECMLRSSQKAG